MWGLSLRSGHRSIVIIVVRVLRATTSRCHARSKQLISSGRSRGVDFRATAARPSVMPTSDHSHTATCGLSRVGSKYAFINDRRDADDAHLDQRRPRTAGRPLATGAGCAASSRTTRAQSASPDRGADQSHAGEHVDVGVVRAAQRVLRLTLKADLRRDVGTEPEPGEHPLLGLHLLDDRRPQLVAELDVAVEVAGRRCASPLPVRLPMFCDELFDRDAAACSPGRI